MSVTEIKRPNFYEGQYLGAQDLIAGQEYQRQQDQRHRLAAHTWGIAVGLELEERPQPASSDAVDVYVKPGYAVDGFGRAIVVLEPYKLPEALFAQFRFDPALPEGVWVPVWICYREEKTNPPASGFAVCDGGDQAYRISETFRLVVGELPLVALQRDQISVAGKSLDAADEIPDGSVPYQAFPDDGQSARWLIRLGTVRWLAPNPPATTIGHFVKSVTEQELKKAREGRSYIGVVAESVLAPAGKLRIRDRKNPGLAINESADLVGIEGSLRVDGISHCRDLLITDSYVNIDSQNLNTGDPTPLNGLGGPALTFGLLSFEGIASKRTASGNQFGLDFYTKNVARLSITNDGNVGIGTTSPSHKLHVMAPDAVGLFESSGTQAFLRLMVTSDGFGKRVEITNRPGGRLSLWVNNEDVLNITQEHNVGIGTTNPSHKFHVLAADAVGLFESTGTQAFLRLSTTEGLNNRVEITNRPGGRLSLFTSGAGDAFNITRDGNVGIGTTSPGLKLDIKGDFGRDDGSATVHLFGSRVGDIGGGILFLRSGGGVVAFDGNDSVGIGTTTPGFKLDVAGQAHASSFPSSSDDRFKTNLRPLENVLDKVQKIRGVSFEWNEKYAALGRATGKPELGVLAQEVEAVFPELVSRWGDEQHLAVDYGRLAAVLVEAIKELIDQNETLAKRLDALERRKSKSSKKPTE